MVLYLCNDWHSGATTILLHIHVLPFNASLHDATHHMIAQRTVLCKTGKRFYNHCSFRGTISNSLLIVLNIFSKSWKCRFRTAFPFWWHETLSGQSACCRSRFIKHPDPAAQDDGGEKNQSDGGEEGKWRGTELTALVSSQSGRSSKVSTTLIPSSSSSSSLTSVTSAGHSVWNPLISFLSLWVFFLFV